MSFSRMLSFRTAVISVSIKPGATTLTVTRGKFLCRRLGEADHARLCGCVVRLSDISDLTDNGGEVHNTSAALLRHELCSSLRAGVNPLEIRINDGIEILILHTDKERITRDARVVDENVQPAELLMYACDHLGRRRAVRDIRLNDHRRTAVLLDDRLDLLGSRLIAGVVDRDFRPLFGKTKCNRTSNPAGSARNKSNFPIKKHESPPSS